ncbi:MAG: TM0106 family RecB-like putative nuclease [Leptolyngbyaceae cyanobacterium MO_188.B28]|nr:TM0106 family RecB-like putative nuclease [Leptolyngbyaceae cyanobacterium MO_188.B28]
MSAIPIITSEIFVAYSQCPRKAFLLLFSEDRGKLHDYSLILEERRQNNRAQYLEKFLQSYPEARMYDIKAFKKHELLVEAKLRSEQLEAYCTVLNKADTNSAYRRTSYNPTIVTGTYSVTPEQKTELLFVGSVLGQIQKQLPAVGQIVSMDGKAHRVHLESGYKSIKPSLKMLQNWCNKPPIDPPPLILNPNCPSCQFQQICRQQAEKENNLSLLDRMTPKAIQKYNKRGIFTVQQLSYLFKPRRKRKKRKNPEPIKHSLELQALAIRENKIYIQEMPELTRQSMELFLDIEGIPDQQFYYLIGLLVCEGEKCIQYSFWADTPEEEEMIWKQFLSKLSEYPEASIYHYGSYEIKAISKLAKRYTTDIEKVIKHLININSYIYGKIYFPTFSNRLKEIGTLIGASWASPNSSGLQSLVWRYQWEENPHSTYKKNLLVYNNGDCNALKLLTNKIYEISSQDGLNSCIAFADEKRKLSTEVGKEIHSHLEFILKSSHADYDRKKIAFRDRGNDRIHKRQKDNQKDHKRFVRVAPLKANKTIEVPVITNCKKCSEELSQDKQQAISIIVIDLNFTKSGYRKVIYLYKGFKSYCNLCKRYSAPDVFCRSLGGYVFGHGFKSWIVYQRISLRLSYRLIAKNSISRLTCKVRGARSFIKQA